MSNLKFKATITDYASADSFLGDKNERVLGHNTTVRRVDTETIAVRYHQTDIVTYAPTFTLVDHGGWGTMTTANRLHMLTPSGVRFNCKRKDETIIVTLSNGEVYDLDHGPVEI